MSRRVPSPLHLTADHPTEDPAAFPTAIFQSSSVEFRAAIIALLREKEAAGTRYKSLQDKLSYVRRELVDPYARQKDMTNITPNTIQDILRDALAGESLRRRVGMLQNEVRRLRWEKDPEGEQMRTDGRFQSLFRELSSHIHDLVTAVVAKPDANPYIDAILTATLVAPVNKEFWQQYDLGSYLLTAFTWSVLLDIVFASPFSPFLSTQGDYCGRFWRRLFGSQHDETCANANPPCRSYDHAWPVPSEASERWKASTFEALTVDPTGPENTVTRKEEVGNRILGALDAVVRGSSTDRVIMGITKRTIIKAFELAEQIGMQWERVQFWVPQIGDQYPGDGGQGRARRLRLVINGGLTEGRVSAIISPGLIRWGFGESREEDEGSVLIPSGVLAIEAGAA